MSIIGTIHEDVTTEVIGKIGSWQWFVTFLSTSLMIPALFNQYEDGFMLHPTNVVCFPPQSLVVDNISLCFVTTNNGTNVKCTKWHVKLMWLIWLKKSWMVFCEKELTLLSTAIICRLGHIFGCIIFGLLSDSLGRKTAIMIDLIATTGLEIILTFCDAEGWFRLLIFLKALFGSANLFMGLLLICEISSSSWRVVLTTIGVTPRLIAMVCAVPFANALPNMETYGFIAALLYLACAGILRWLPESPQWLLHNRKIHIAENILKKAAKMNGIRLCQDFKIRPVNHRAYNSLDETMTCVGVLTTHNIRTVFMVTTSFWTIFYFVWSSLYVRVYREERVSELLLKVFLFVGLFGCLTMMTSRRIALRYLLMLHAILTGVMTICIVFIWKGVARVVMSSAAISTGIIVHALLLNITPRLFAINIRSSAFGSCHATGQLGSIIGYFFYLSQPMGNVTFTFVVLLATVILVGLCLVLPNVDGRELPDVLQDMDFYSELSKPLRWVTQKTSSPSLEEVEMRVHSFGSQRSASTSTPPQAREAQRIGFARLWRVIAEYLRRKIGRIK